MSPFDEMYRSTFGIDNSVARPLTPAEEDAQEEATEAAEAKQEEACRAALEKGAPEISEWIGENADVFRLAMKAAVAGGDTSHILRSLFRDFQDAGYFRE